MRTPFDPAQTSLRYESYKLSKMVCLFVRVDLEDLPDTVIVVPLLQKLLLVCDGVTLDKILQLGQI